MERLAPVGDTYQAGTLSGNPLATAAGLATLRLLDGGAYERLARLSERLASALRAEAEATGAPVQVESVCGLLTLFFSERPVRNYEDAQAADGDAYARFFAGMLARGVYLPPSPFEAWFPSLAHDDAALDRTIEAAGEALAEGIGQ